MFGLGKPRRPKVVAFDIIGTVFPLEPLRPDLVALGLAPGSLETWFASGLRDAFGLAAAGDFKPFATVLDGALDQLAGREGLTVSAAARRHVLDRLTSLPPRPDAPQAFAELRDSGIGIVALSNGASSSTKSLLKGGMLDHFVDHILSVDDVKLSKPRPEVYHYAAAAAGVAPEAMMLVAIHPWDINGAKAAGLSTAYVSVETGYPATMRPADLEASSLLGAARTITALAAAG